MILTTNAIATSSRTKPISIKNMMTSVDEYLASNDPWAIAYPGIPLPLPYRIGWIEDSNVCSYLNRQMEEIPGILSSFNIRALSISAAKCWRTSTKKARLIISIQVEGEKAELWSQAARKVHMMLQDDCLASFQVEISNPSKREGHLISRDPPHAEATAVFDSIADEISKVVGRLGDICNGFGLYLFGNKDNLQPTVVVFVEEQAEWDWVYFLRTCEAVIGSVNLSIQIQPGVLQRGATEIDSSPPSSQRVYREPKNGSSLGIKGGGAIGTLGAFILLEFGSEIMSCGLTCQHVVAPADPKLAATFYRSGLGDDQLMASAARTTLQYPSKLDLSASIDKSTRFLSEIDGSIETMTVRQTQHLAKVRQELAVATDLDASERDLGKVLFSSGIRSGAIGCKNHHDFSRLEGETSEEFEAHKFCKEEVCKGLDHARMDWATFDMPKHLFKVNKAPADNDIKPRALNYRCGDNFLISEIAPIKPNTWVCKDGRTTGVTTGWVGVNRHYGRWVDEFPNDDGQKTVVFKTWTKDWIVYAYEDGNPVSRNNFAQPGDSGSCVVDEHGRMVALLTGGIDTGGQSIALATDIGIIFADIEAKTGGKVRLPHSINLSLIDQVTDFIKGIFTARWW